MRVGIIIAAGVLLTVVGLVSYHHLQQPSRPTPPEQAEQFAVANSRDAGFFAPRLPAPRLPVAPTPAEAEPESLLATNLFARLMSGNFPRLTAEELEPYLQQHNRSTESLLGAFAATGDRAFLREALEKNPDNPRLNLTAYYLGDARAAESERGRNGDQPASAERRQLLDAFTKAAPDNSLPNYLLALDCFKAGQTDRAVEQLVAASQKSKFQDYSLQNIQDTEEAYRATGWSEAQAKAVASSQLPLPYLADLKQTGYKLVELAALYRQAGDEASAQAAEQIGLGLGQHLTEPGQLTIIQELVGIAIERKVLSSMDPNRVLDTTGQTVQGRLDALDQRKAAIKTIAKPVSNILPTLSEPDLANYFDRIKLFGETAALEWLVKTHNQQSFPDVVQTH